MAAIKQIILLMQRIDGVGGGEKENERETDRQRKHLYRVWIQRNGI